MIIEVKDGTMHLAELDDGEVIFVGGVADKLLTKCGEEVIMEKLHNLGDVDVTCEKCLKLQQ